MNTHTRKRIGYYLKISLLIFTQRPMNELQLNRLVVDCFEAKVECAFDSKDNILWAHTRNQAFQFKGFQAQQTFHMILEMMMPV